jgi:hypothetical protein
MSAHRGENVPLVRISRPRRAAGLLVASAALVLSAAACGGGSSTSSTGTGTGTDGNSGGNNAFAAYTQCLQQNGVTITTPSGGPRTRPSDGAGLPGGQPRPSGGARGGGGFPGGGAMQKPDNVSQDTWDKAQAACKSLQPSGGAGRGGNGATGANAAYRNCLQQHGVTVGQNGLNTTDPTVKKAEETCKVLSPAASATPTA